MRTLLSIFLVIVFTFMAGVLAFASPADMGVGLPIGGGDEPPDRDICPAGFSVVESFLKAWEKEDFDAMYNMIDDDSKKDYSLKDAVFTFRLIEYKPYTISSVRKKGDDFEFIVSYGSWRDGDKDIQKMIVSGKTFKIIMPSRNSFFKKSIADYF